MKRELTKILGLSGMIVTAQKSIENTLILDVEARRKTAICPTCLQISNRLHQNHWHLVRDIPWGENEIILRLNRRQFKCDYCGKPFSEELNFVGKKQKYTNRYAQFISEKIVNNDVENILKKNNLTNSQAKSIINQITKKKLMFNVKNLKRLGIHQIDLTKIQSSIKIALIDLDTGRLIGLTKERKVKTLENILMSWGNEILGKIEEIRTNLSKTYQDAVGKFCPQATIIENDYNNNT